MLTSLKFSIFFVVLKNYLMLLCMHYWKSYKINRCNSSILPLWNYRIIVPLQKYHVLVRSYSFGILQIVNLLRKKIPAASTFGWLLCFRFSDVIWHISFPFTWFRSRGEMVQFINLVRNIETKLVYFGLKAPNWKQTKIVQLDRNISFKPPIRFIFWGLFGKYQTIGSIGSINPTQIFILSFVWLSLV